MDMFVEIVDFKICDRSDAALREVSISLFESGFTYNCDAMSATCGLKRERHAGYAGANDQIVVSKSHFL